MRLPFSVVSGLPCESSTATVLVPPSAVTFTRYLARPVSFFLLPEKSRLKKFGSSRPAKAGST